MILKTIVVPEVTVPVDDWKAKDLIAYIRYVCFQKKVACNLAAGNKKNQYISANYALRLCTLNGKTKDWLRKQIDNYFEKNTLTSINSILFLNNITTQLPIRIKQNSNYYKEKEFTIKEKTKETLRQLRRKARDW